MSFQVTAVRVMIASPSDTLSARNTVETAINEWNYNHAERRKIVLLPWRWEVSAVPMLGDHPQALINAQGVSRSDIVFALFGTKLGTPTPNAISGTVEEIERAESQGKPVHVYFSSAPLPYNIDAKNLEGLRKFKKEMQNRGLLGEFEHEDQLRNEVLKALEFDLEKLDLNTPREASGRNIATFTVQPRQEKYQTGIDDRGKAKFKTDYWLEITNTSQYDAEEVTFEVAGDGPSMALLTGENPTVIHAGQTRRLNVARFAGGNDPVLLIRWREGDRFSSKEFHI